MTVLQPPSQKGQWTESALKVLRERYLHYDEQGRQETPEDMCWRVASAIAHAERTWGRSPEEVHEIATQFYRLMVDGLFLPNSPTLMNAGLKDNGLQYSACYVLAVEDSLEGIFDAVKNAAIIHQSGGGTGFSFSRLRPAGSRVQTSGGVASGPVSFMTVFDAATETIRQGGRRRGANMGILRVDHPDVLDFIDCKLKGGITNFNISVAATDAFMEALKNDGEYELLAQPGWPRPGGGKYQGGEVIGRLNAPEVFDRIVRAAWQTGDPGMVFIDRINSSPANPVPEMGQIEATNPCHRGPNLVHTNLGVVPIKDLVGRDFCVVTPGGEIARAVAYPTGVKPLFRVHLDNGATIDLTENHNLVMADGCKKAVRDLRPGDRVKLAEHAIEPLEADYEFTFVDSSAKQVVARAVLARPWCGGQSAGSTSVVRVENLHLTEMVYNLTVDHPTHQFAVNGVISANCGEQPLLPNEACNLGSINLAALADLDSRANGRASIDRDELERVVRVAVRFLDDVIQVNPYPLPEIDAAVKANRRIGLGVMGWADLLFDLGIPYDSDEALALAAQVMSFIQEVGHDESAKLAEERGPFPHWSQSIYKAGRPLRNSTVTTIAPTGTISIIAGCSSGIEPAFALAFEHRVQQTEGRERRLTFVNPVFERVAREEGFYSEELMAQVARHGTVHGLADVPAEVAHVFATAHEIAPEWHVRMQAAFQRFTDNGVSKTINLPNYATVEDVARAYRLAYDLGCLGITVFRDGSKQHQVLHVGTAGEKDETPPANGHVVKPRPQSLRGVTYRQQTPLGTAFITVNENGTGEPFEAFVSVGKAGSDTAAVAEALGRLISLCLRLPSTLSPRDKVVEIVGQLTGIGGRRALGFGTDRVRSLPDGIARVLAEHIDMLDDRDSAEQLSFFQGDLCPECGQATLAFEEGCRKCHSCGFSEC